MALQCASVCVCVLLGLCVFRVMYLAKLHSKSALACALNEFTHTPNIQTDQPTPKSSWATTCNGYSEAFCCAHMSRDIRRWRRILYRTSKLELSGDFVFFSPRHMCACDGQKNRPIRTRSPAGVTSLKLGSGFGSGVFCGRSARESAQHFVVNVE